MKNKKTQEELFYAWTDEVGFLSQFQGIIQNDFDLLIQGGATKDQILEMKKLWQNEFYEVVEHLNRLSQEIGEFIDAKVSAGFPKKGKK